MMFWIWGDPGSASIVKVNAPSAMVAGSSRLGMSDARNSSAAKGYTANATTKRDTPPYVSTAQTSTTAAIACRGPVKRSIPLMIARAKPETSISFPNTAPSRNKGKYNLMNPAIRSRNRPEYMGRIRAGSVSATASSAATGANRITLAPR